MPHIGHRLRDVQRRGLDHRHGGARRVRQRRVGVGGGGVVDEAGQRIFHRAVGIDVGLGHRVARRIGPGLADLQVAVAIIAADEGHAGVQRIGHHDPGQRLIAGVGHRDRVGNHLPPHRRSRPPRLPPHR